MCDLLCLSGTDGPHGWGGGGGGAEGGSARRKIPAGVRYPAF